MTNTRTERILLAVLAIVIAAASAHAQQIAFTWDDVPSHGPLPAGDIRLGISHKIVEAMQKARLPPAYGFVNGVALDREPRSEPVLTDWRDAGFPLGNHTWSHMNLNSATLADWEADVLKNEPILKAYADKNAAGSDWHWLRYPYLVEGDPEKRAAARQFLAEHHYRIAAVTMSFGDYMWNEPYARCVAKNDTVAIAQLENSYLRAASEDADFRRAMAKSLFGHDIPYVLLMHVGAFDARMITRLIDLYKQKGFTFVTLEEAEKDPFYQSSLDPSLPAAPDLLESAMQARGLPVPPGPKPTVDVNNLCR